MKGEGIASMIPVAFSDDLDCTTSLQAITTMKILKAWRS